MTRRRVLRWAYLPGENLVAAEARVDSTTGDRAICLHSLDATRLAGQAISATARRCGTPAKC